MRVYMMMMKKTFPFKVSIVQWRSSSLVYCSRVGSVSVSFSVTKAGWSPTVSAVTKSTFCAGSVPWDFFYQLCHFVVMLLLFVWQ